MVPGRARRRDPGRDRWGGSDAMTTKRVTMVSFHPMSGGQAASTHVDSIAAGLRDLGWSVRIVAEARRADDRGLLSRVVGWGRILLRSLAVLSRSDVLYVRSHPAAAPLVGAARLARVPVVVEVNGPDEDYFIAWPQLRRAAWIVHAPVRWQLRATSAIIAVTDGLARWAQERSGRPTVVIPNGVDASRFSEIAVSANDRDEPYAIYLGALAPWQGLTELLGAIEHPAWPPEVRLIIAGDGSERALVERTVARFPDRVQWLGHISPSDVPRLLGGALASFVLSRDRHGTGVSPIKLYESMAAGTPVIAAEVPGASDTVRATDCGVVVPIDDVGAVASAVREFADDSLSACEMGLRGRAAAIGQHTWSHRAAATDYLLESLLGHERP